MQCIFILYFVVPFEENSQHPLQIYVIIARQGYICSLHVVNACYQQWRTTVLTVSPPGLNISNKNALEMNSVVRDNRDLT